jgi:hypothetical protein
MEARKREAWAAVSKVTRRGPARTKSPVFSYSPLVAFLSAAFKLDTKQENSDRTGDCLTRRDGGGRGFLISPLEGFRERVGDEGRAADCSARRRTVPHREEGSETTGRCQTLRRRVSLSLSFPPSRLEPLDGWKRQQLFHQPPQTTRFEGSLSRGFGEVFVNAEVEEGGIRSDGSGASQERFGALARWGAVFRARGGGVGFPGEEEHERLEEVGDADSGEAAVQEKRGGGIAKRADKLASIF